MASWPKEHARRGVDNNQPVAAIGPPSAAIPRDLPDVAALHAKTYLARNFLRMGKKNDPRGFLVSPRPVSRCAICRNILVVR